MPCLNTYRQGNSLRRIVMKRKTILVLTALILSTSLCGCNDKKNDQPAPSPAVSLTEESVTETSVVETSLPEEPAAEIILEDGQYIADFTTDNSMFHVNEVCEGKGTITVVDGQMTIHLVMPSKNVVNLYYGLAEDAQKDGAELIEPSVEEVTYSDGSTEEVYAYDVPVPYLDKEFDLALIGTKGIWYDHKVVVSNPLDMTNSELPSAIEEGKYTVEFDFEGGSGKAYIESPANLTIGQDGMTATITWSSPNYDYMLVDDVKYLPINEEGNSVFEIPVSSLDEPITVVGDTVAMSKPHEIEYTLTFHSDTLKPVSDTE